MSDLDKVLRALYLVVDETVAEDVGKKVRAALEQARVDALEEAAKRCEREAAALSSGAATGTRYIHGADFCTSCAFWIRSLKQKGTS